MTMTRNTRYRCGNCKFWDEIVGATGRCRRYPPFYRTKGNDGFPKTSFLSWCGEYQKDAVMSKKYTGTGKIAVSNVRKGGHNPPPTTPKPKVVPPSQKAKTKKT